MITNKIERKGKEKIMKRYKESFKMSEIGNPKKLSTFDLFQRCKFDSKQKKQFFNIISETVEMFGDEYDLRDLQDKNEDINIVNKLNEFLKNNEYNGFKLRSIYEVDDPEDYYFTYNIQIINSTNPFLKGK